MNQQDIEQVVKAVLLKMQSSDTPSAAVHEMGVFASLDDAVAAAKVAQQGLKSVAMRQLAIAAIREAGEKHARDLAELAVSETGMGRVEDKFAKNVAQARGTPGVECLSPQVLTGDNGLTLIENAPWGVVASVTPSTNPAATVINNAISLIAAGNSVIFAPHPAAKKVSQRAITLLNQAIVAAGGPENLLVTVANPDIETAQRLFKFPGIGLLVVTGGEAVVEAARKHTNKRLIAAGAGNRLPVSPPAQWHPPRWRRARRAAPASSVRSRQTDVLQWFPQTANAFLAARSGRLPPRFSPHRDQPSHG